jgi:L-asparaginase II
VLANAAGAAVAVAGDPSRASYLRSAAKPIQLLTMLEEGLGECTHLDDRSLALMAASHGGEPGHVRLVQELLDQAGLHPSQLLCGPAPPLDEAAHRELIHLGEPPREVHNNCSGKHTAMLLTCQVRGWPLEQYLDRDHPLQQAILKRIAGLTGEAPGVGVDGCSVPTFFVTVMGAARMTARFMESTRHGGWAGRVLDAMTRQPWFTSGSCRLAYRLMTAAPGLLAKEGAEGFFIVGIPAARSPWGGPAGLALKVLDGGGDVQRGREPAILAALTSAGVLDLHVLSQGWPLDARHLCAWWVCAGAD